MFMVDQNLNEVLVLLSVHYELEKVIKRSLEEIQDLKDTNDLIKVRSSQ